LGFEKSVLYEFAYVMFLIGEWAWELIIWIQTS
jgi:hypothetical protein